MMTQRWRESIKRWPRSTNGGTDESSSCTWLGGLAMTAQKGREVMRKAAHDEAPFYRCALGRRKMGCREGPRARVWSGPMASSNGMWRAWTARHAKWLARGQELGRLCSQVVDLSASPLSKRGGCDTVAMANGAARCSSRQAHRRGRCDLERLARTQWWMTANERAQRGAVET
jgi:hypothetical protein